jgi:hypothetical protein
MKLTPFRGIFGLPPASHVSDSMIVNSMPVMDITPGKPNFESGLTLFSVDDDWTSYHKILNTLGYQLSTNEIKLAFIADNFPTDTFSNEYGETFLQKFTDVASQGMQQIAQMTGAETGTKAMANLGQSFQSVGGEVGGMMGDIISGVGSGAAKTAAGLQSLKKSMAGSKMLGGAANMVDKMLAGHRVDFPNIWRNSGFTPSYTATIRLYNPNPGNPESTKRHIIGPLAVILCLAIPRSDDGKTFNWPFFHKIKSAGIYGLDPAVITNVTVVKGGDQQQISFNQKLAMVDVRIDFTSLYSTMILEENKTFETHKPTVNNYLNSLKENDTSLSFKRNRMNFEAANAAAVGGQGPNIRISALPQFDASTRNSVQLALSKTTSSRKRIPPTIIEKEVSNRVNIATADIEDLLKTQSPRAFIS